MRIKTIKSFQCALRGLGYTFQEQTVRIMLLIALSVIFLTFFFDTSPTEKALVFLTITLVLGLELINSQVERTLDIVEPQFSQRVREIKDISAGAVLVASLGALLIGIIIFLPFLLQLLKPFS
jgi:diacylglycerol kinase